MSADETAVESPRICGPVTLGAWNKAVRSARMGLKRKGISMLFGSYANNDGGSIKCGVARFATDMEASYATARRHIAWLREVGLVESVKAGNHKTGRADEYRLTLQPRTYELLDIPTDEQYRAMVADVSEANRSREKTYRLRSPRMSADSSDHAESSALNSIASAEDGYLRSISEPSALIPMVSAHLPVTTSQDQAPPTGGAPPPDPRRPEPPPTSGSRLEAQQELSAAHHPAPDLQRNSRPHASARAPDALSAVVLDMFTREAM